jgi:hypothetical protein
MLYLRLLFLQAMLHGSAALVEAVAKMCLPLVLACFFACLPDCLRCRGALLRWLKVRIQERHVACLHVGGGPLLHATTASAALCL